MKKAKAIIAVLVVSFLFTTLITAQQTGKEIYLESKCNTCHSIQSQDITSKQADKYPDLSDIGNVEKYGLDAEKMKKYLNKEFDLPTSGKKHPVKFKGSDEQLTILVDWLLTLKKK